LQNKPIPKDALFVGVDGKPMSKPGDLSGGPQNTINCSCTVVYISERFARKNYPESFGGSPEKTIISGEQTGQDFEKPRIKDELFASLESDEVNAKFRDVLDGSDGVNEIINQSGTFVSIKAKEFKDDPFNFYKKVNAKFENRDEYDKEFMNNVFYIDL
jgi:hypothetical protein